MPCVGWLTVSSESGGSAEKLRDMSWQSVPEL